ncbi:hypothetical protein SAMN05444149_10870 [Pseudosulfitobacter pseudonitzschiae]|uniref:Uncharacterized protein n=1 Tax=Pseudosulfitobacter pseudonitzschiae TaxID=1402135 RepID=A0A073IWX0_9RHOB|nr:hypothetical protein [Pseudosulfitobacter pseudonitzschiae]KEJ93956.1 hypothetical protein SUH3_11835 [Pseudosulfitobacter pseudonitzschiae]SHG00757.1 hypothetical protein SAMN05444149_10870 [Pseudosulfitobacter pseudonitzschiae]
MRKINTLAKVSSVQNLPQRRAIEIAIGCFLPTDVNEWPAGLVRAWNGAINAGEIKGDTIRTMAAEFLEYRSAKLKRRPDA